MADKQPKQLSDDALLVRGGLMADRKDMQQQAEDALELCGLHALSLGGDDRMNLHDLAMANRRPNPRLRKSTAARTRAAGFALTYPKGKKRHCDLILPRPMTDKDWDALEQAFDPAEPNPYYHAKRGEVTT